MVRTILRKKDKKSYPSDRVKVLSDYRKWTALKQLYKAYWVQWAV
jgi:hypothetical protein